MLPGRCGSMGGSRRLSLQSTASCPFTSGPSFAPCRPTQPGRQLPEYPARGSCTGSNVGSSSSSPPGPRRACGIEAVGAPPSGTHAAAITSTTTTTPVITVASASSISSSNPNSGGERGTSSSRSSSCGSSDSRGGCSRISNGEVKQGVAVAVVATGTADGSPVEDTTSEDWRVPLRRPGSVVALGKFDALHRGHCALAAAAAALAREVHAAQCAADTADGGADGAGCNGSEPGATASAAGDAVLLSFSGMAAVLGWPDRLPLTAPQDRGRVLAGWAAACSGDVLNYRNYNGDGNSGDGNNGNGKQCAQQLSAAPEGLCGASSAGGSGGSGAAEVAMVPLRLRTMPFSLIRGMSPEEFVALVARDLGAAGVVAGRNYRFGYKAAGDADTLVRLGREYGMRVAIVDLVTLPDVRVTSKDSVGAASANDALAAATAASSSSTGGCSNSSSTGSSSSRGLRDRSTAAGVSSPSSSPSWSVVGAGAPNNGVGSSGVGTQFGSNGSAISAHGGGSIRSGGDGSEAVSSSRVSSSRIRELLEQGQVESVEQLLGRKYRLVCDLAAATVGAPSRNRSSSDADGVGGGSCCGAGHQARLVLPCTSYQNQPPASGQYRALVHLVREAQMAAGQGSEGLTTAASGDAVEDGYGRDGGVLSSGGACVMVQLSESGLELDLGEAGRSVAKSLVGGGGLLMVDFDACG